jgi:hypothetical protein
LAQNKIQSKQINNNNENLKKKRAKVISWVQSPIQEKKKKEIFIYLFIYLYETGSRYIAQAALNLQSSCLCLLDAGITGLHLHV